MVAQDETARERRSSMRGFLATLAGSPLRHFLLLAADGVAAPLCLLVAYYLRFDGNLERATGLAFLLVLVVAARMAAAMIVR